VEIREAVGEENFFHFGLTTDGVHALQAAGYRPRDYYESNPDLKAALDLIASGHFSRGNRDLFRPLVDNLLHHDPFLVLADFESYIECQGRVSQAWGDQDRWTRMSILNTARMGRFSSDRTIAEYSRDIWRAEPSPVPLVDV
jgi:starch phosphorylase